MSHHLLRYVKEVFSRCLYSVLLELGRTYELLEIGGFYAGGDSVTINGCRIRRTQRRVDRENYVDPCLSQTMQMRLTDNFWLIRQRGQGQMAATSPSGCLYTRFPYDSCGHATTPAPLHLRSAYWGSQFGSTLECQHRRRGKAFLHPEEITKWISAVDVLGH